MCVYIRKGCVCVDNVNVHNVNVHNVGVRVVSIYTNMTNIEG